MGTESSVNIIVRDSRKSPRVLELGAFPKIFRYIWKKNQFYGTEGLPFLLYIAEFVFTLIVSRIFYHVFSKAMLLFDISSPPSQVTSCS